MPMKLRSKSPTYVSSIELLFKYGKQVTDTALHANDYRAGKFSKTDTGFKSKRIRQPIVITDTGLYNKCNRAEWHLLGRITTELNEYCMLWHLPEDCRGASVRSAVTGLIAKGILARTETHHIYLVNPMELRRGDLMDVIATTANALKNASKVTVEHIRDYRSVKEYDFSFDMLSLPSH